MRSRSSSWISAWCVVCLAGCSSAPQLPVRLAADGDAAELATLAARINAGEGAIAVDELQALAQRHPRSTSVWLDLGLALESAGNADAARAAWEQALALDPGHCGSRVALGLAARRAGDFETSEAHYLACLQADPGYAPALINLGVLYELYLQRLPQAVSMYGRYLETHTDPEVAAWLDDLDKRMAGYAARN